jgi:amidase
MSDLAYLGARALARKIRRKELSSLEVVDYFLARIEQKNPGINAVVTLDASGARAAAERADQALARGDVLGPLHGVPLTVKDAYEVAGMRSTAGAKVWSEHVPTRDAVSVQRLRAAGAIILGKTNTPAFCSDLQSYNPLFGTTNNPWDVTRTPGGSSGGSAAALASGMTPVELGSDIAGSIRTPAAFCGLFGHKPTYGIVPMRGHLPGPPGTLSAADLAVCGPLATSAEDLALMLHVLAGPLPEQAKAYRLQLPAARAQTLRGYRVAVWLEDASATVDRSVLTLLSGATESLRRAGAKLEVVHPEFELKAAYDIYRSLLDPVMSVGMPKKLLSMLEELNKNSAADATDPLTSFARRGLVRHRDFVVWVELRERLRAVWAQFFENYDVLLCPVTPTPAIVHDHSDPIPLRTILVNGEPRAYEDQFVWNSLATCFHLPATVLPAGRTPEGLPVGLQVVGPYLEDFTTIDFAGRASEILGGFVPPTGY